MLRLPLISTRTDTSCPNTTRFRSPVRAADAAGAEVLCERVPQHAVGPGQPVASSPKNESREVAGKSQFVSVERKPGGPGASLGEGDRREFGERSEEHTSELQSLMRISYAVFCLKKKNNTDT